MIYLDNGATTEICKEAIDAVNRSFSDFGNPSSLHKLGAQAQMRLRACCASVEKVLGAEDKSFYFTSGATESNNWAIMGTSLFNEKEGRHIITSKTEHPAVIEPFRELKRRGFDVDFIGTDSKGNLDIDELVSKVRSDTVLVSIMHVNNETGVMNDIQTIVRKVKAINRRTVFHSDGVAAYCKIPVNVKTLGVDLYSVSGHKIHAPKGIGGLYVKKGTRIHPLIYGGGQQGNMRSGTENTLFIEGFAAASNAGSADIAGKMSNIARLKRKLLCGLSGIDCCEIIGETDEGKSSPYVLCAGFKGLKSQIILNALEQNNIYVSAGSACSSNKKMQNEGLRALGLAEEVLEGAVRFSFSRFTTENEIDELLNALSDIIRRYKR